MTTREHVSIEMADGVRLAATLYVPEGGDGSRRPLAGRARGAPLSQGRRDGAFPQRVPAPRGGRVRGLPRRRPGHRLERGHPDRRVPAVERTDLATVIDWLATQPWSLGTVGMYGYSYSGFNSVQIAMERPPALKAIIPIYATDDRYGDDVHYFGGVVKQLDQIDYPSYMVARNALPPAPPIYGEGWRAEWDRRLEGTEPWVITWLEHQRLDDYWKAGSLFVDYEAIECATMIVAGWADGYRNNSLRTFERLRCPKRLVIGPWAHASTETSLPGPNHDLTPEHIRWWDRWLKGIDNGVDREPPIVLFAQRSTLPAPDRAEVRGEWRYEPTWPAERLMPAGWRLRDAKPTGRTLSIELDVRGDVGHTAWISCAGCSRGASPTTSGPTSSTPSPTRGNRSSRSSRSSVMPGCWPASRRPRQSRSCRRSSATSSPTARRRSSPAAC